MESPAIISALALLTGAVLIIWSISLCIGTKNKALYVSSARLQFFIFFLVFIMPFFFVTFVAYYAPSYSLRIPPDLLSWSILLSGVCLSYSIVKLTSVSAAILKHGVSRKVRYKDELKKHTLNDKLTGIYNKRGFITHIKHHIRLSIRNSKKILLFYAKIDDFKELSTTLGYEERDIMLVETAKLLFSTFRNSDIVARVSEDSFLIFMIGASEEYARTVSDNFQDKIEFFNAKRNNKYRIPLRYCVVHYDPGYNDHIENIIAQAEDFMSAKYDSTSTACLEKEQFV